MVRLILPVLLLHAIRAQVHENYERDDCLKGEPENAVMLQAFTDKKYDENFARDVLQVSKLDSTPACNAAVFDGTTNDGPFFHGENEKVCGALELKDTNGNNLCSRDDHEKEACWNIKPECTRDSNLANQYTYKFADRGRQFTSIRVKSPLGYGYVCITGTCTTSLDGRQLCTHIENPSQGVSVEIKSIDFPFPPPVINYRIQYACGRGCDPSTDPNPDSPGGGGDGDPHIHTLKGDHYTLIKQGNFLAFSFKGKEALVAPAPYDPYGSSHSHGASVPVDFELFAHYNSGRKSFTRGLLLLDHQNHQAMEMTSEDCRWQVRAGESDWKTLTEWRKSVSKSEVSSDLLYKRGNGAYFTGLNISRAETTVNISKNVLNRSLTRAEIHGFGGKTLKSYVKAEILINMNTPTGLTDVVKLTVKCFPGYHMNYNVNMSNAKDLSFVGGELGGTSKGGTSKGQNEIQEFLEVGQGTIQMRSDSRFQYHQKWEELGGSASAALYLQDQDDSAADSSELMTTPCTESDQQQAKEICRKAGLKNEATRSFAECVFDVCRAGGDALPELTEISWREDD